jgi:hypothetical protein
VSCSLTAGGRKALDAVEGTMLRMVESSRSSSMGEGSMKLLRDRIYQGNVRAALAALVFVSSIALAAPDASAQGRRPPQRPPQNFSVLPVTITSVTVQDGQLFANGLIGATAFRTPLAIAAQQAGAACPILDLSLGPIDLNLLGLRVQTSPICLEITAHEGQGVLGTLLCNVANLLQGGMPLADVLNQLQAQGQLTNFLNGLTSVLDQVFDRITANDALAAATCSILSLEVGPLNLNLLGLEVELDDCNNGPVTVDITAIQGGGLLGDLLCSLSDLLNGGGSATAIQTVLFQISRVLGQLLG